MKRILLSLLIAFFLLLCSLSAVFYFKKDSIKDDVIQKINKSLKVQVSTKSVDVVLFDTFPKVTVIFSHLKIINNNKSLPDLCGIQKVSCSFNLLDIFDNRIHLDELNLEGGYINVHVDKKGVTNFDIFHASENTFSKDISKLNLKNIKFTFEDKQKANRYPLTFKSLKLSKQILLHDSLQSIINCQSKFVIEKDSQSWLHPLESMNIKSNFSIIYKEGISNFTIDKTVNLTVGKYPIALNGNLSLEDSVHTKLNYKFLKEVPLSFLQSYIPDKMDEYIPFLLHEKVGVLASGNFYGNIPKKKTFVFNISKMKYRGTNGQFEGKVKYSNKKTRLLKVKFKGNCNYSMLKKLPVYKEIKEYMSLDGGKFEGEISYSTNLDLPTEALVNSNSYQINADIAFSGLRVQIPNLPYPMHQLKGNLSLDKNHAIIKNSSFAYHKKSIDTKVTLSSLKGWLINREKPNIIIDLTADTIEKNDLVALNANNNKASDFALGKNRYIPDSKIWPFVMNLKLKMLSWDKYILKNIKSKVYIQPNHIDIKNTSFEYTGGKVTLVCSLKTHPKDSRYTKLDLGINSKNVSLSQLFYTSDNFGQSFIQDKHLKGNLSAASSLTAIINPSGKMLNKSLKGYIDFSISDGYLIDFKPILTLSKYLSKVDFHTIKFGQITNRISIDGEEIIIPTILIENSVRNFEISGNHGFNQAINYKLRVPIRAKEKLRSIENPSKSIRGVSLYFNIIGTSDDYEVILEKGKIKGEIKKVLSKETKEWDDRKEMGGKNSKSTIKVNKKKKRLE